VESLDDRRAEGSSGSLDETEVQRAHDARRPFGDARERALVQHDLAALPALNSLGCEPVTIELFGERAEWIVERYEVARRVSAPDSNRIIVTADDVGEHARDLLDRTAREQRIGCRARPVVHCRTAAPTRTLTLLAQQASCHELGQLASDRALVDSEGSRDRRDRDRGSGGNVTNYRKPGRSAERTERGVVRRHVLSFVRLRIFLHRLHENVTLGPLAGTFAPSSRGGPPAKLNP
jgi:hypothetical protein